MSVGHLGWERHVCANKIYPHLNSFIGVCMLEAVLSLLAFGCVLA